MYSIPFYENTDITDKTKALCLMPANTFAWQIEEEIKRSRFITTICQVDSVEKAKENISFLQKKYADATHNCWAYHIGAPKDTSRIGYSDDGEPHGTAGRPMLTQLEGSGFGDVLAIVTRYFGGIKLGTGGLVRAYQGCVQHALEQIPRKEKIPVAQKRFSLSAAQGHVLYQVLGQEACSPIQLLEEKYSDRACFLVEMPESLSSAFCAMLVDACRGDVLWLPD